MNRRQWLRTSAGAGSLAMIPLVGFGARASGSHIFVIRTPACLCCEGWTQQLRNEGYTVTLTDSESLHAAKDRLRIPPELRACHTGIVDGYIIEGHVPAPFIKRLLKEAPKVNGIALPDGPATGTPVVLAFGPDGTAEFKL